MFSANYYVSDIGDDILYCYYCGIEIAIGGEEGECDFLF
jgi:hypothetical protein